MSTPERSRWVAAALAALLLLLVLAVYAQTFGFGFVGFDDDEYLYDNPVVARGLTIDGVRWAFDSHAANWHPVTWLSHMADVELFGLTPGRHHITNVLLHALNAILLFLGLKSLTDATSRSFMVAALFAVHPLNVENVAWLSERKSLLGALFFLLMLFAWTAWVRRSRAVFYAVAVVLYALSLMSKSMAVSAPLLMLMMDVWPLGRAEWGRSRQHLFRFAQLLREKAPFVLIAGVFCFVTLVAQRAGGAMHAAASIPLSARGLNAAISYGWYVAKAVWPSALAPYYVHPFSVGQTVDGVLAFMSAAVLVGGTALLFLSGRSTLIAAWLWYVVALIPVIGLVQVGLQSRADRYAYIPLIAIFIAIVWIAAEASSRIHVARPALAIGVVIIALLAYAAHRQAAYWASTDSLFGRAVAIDDRNWFAWNNLGKAAQMRGDSAYALRCFEKSAALAPKLPQLRFNVGATLASVNRYAEAIPWYESALALNDRDQNVWSNLGIALLATARFPDAVAATSRALELQPGFPHALYGSALAYAAVGDGEAAMRAYKQLNAIDPALAAETLPQVQMSVRRR